MEIVRVDSSSSPTSTACVGKTYAIKSGDTCNSVAASQGISTVNLLSANNLQAFCVNFPTSGSLCIPTAYTCTTYVIKTGDTCTYCQNAAQYVGYVACASNPVGSWVNPYPSSSTVSSSTKLVTLIFPNVKDSVSIPVCPFIKRGKKKFRGIGKPS
jgi:LysM domain